MRFIISAVQLLSREWNHRHLRTAVVIPALARPIAPVQERQGKEEIVDSPWEGDQLAGVSHQVEEPFEIDAGYVDGSNLLRVHVEDPCSVGGNVAQETFDVVGTSFLVNSAEKQVPGSGDEVQPFVALFQRCEVRPLKQRLLGVTSFADVVFSIGSKGSELTPGVFVLPGASAAVAEMRLDETVCRSVSNVDIMLLNIAAESVPFSLAVGGSALSFLPPHVSSPSVAVVMISVCGFRETLGGLDFGCSLLIQ